MLTQKDAHSSLEHMAKDIPLLSPKSSLTTSLWGTVVKTSPQFQTLKKFIRALNAAEKPKFMVLTPN